MIIKLLVSCYNALLDCEHFKILFKKLFYKVSPDTFKHLQCPQKQFQL